MTVSVFVLGVYRACQSHSGLFKHLLRKLLSLDKVPYLSSLISVYLTVSVIDKDNSQYGEHITEESGYAGGIMRYKNSLQQPGKLQNQQYQCNRKSLFTENNHHDDNEDI